MKFPFRPGDTLTKERSRLGKPPLCDQIVSEWAICMQIYLDVKNGGCACVHARVSRCAPVQVYWWLQVISQYMLVQLMCWLLRCRRAQDERTVSDSVLLLCSPLLVQNTTAAGWCEADRAWEPEWENALRGTCRIDAFEKCILLSSYRNAVIKTDITDEMAEHKSGINNSLFLLKCQRLRQFIFFHQWRSGVR